MARTESRIFFTSALSQVLSEEMPVFSFEAQSYIRGYHIYKAVETMPCSQELTNGHNPFAVKVSQLQGEEDYWKFAKISSICSIFLRSEKRHTH